ncbi:DUF7351 domain-containing protein [Halomontanus rarus]|uniref:DUF7351 domain-containing protein n=1 Tax=Halomontanus rarus TaxID=3034020 RepID=UPI001A98947A
MDHSVAVEDAADNISALANSLRIRILLALAETRHPNWDHRGMSYSDLRSAVDVEDGGRFNYHLDRLREQFVRGTDGHYWLTTAGFRIVDDVFAGAFTGDHETVSGPVDWTCPSDGEQLEATLESGVLSVSCPDHGVVFDMTLSFNAAEGREFDELFAWANRRTLWYCEVVAWDVCPHCAGRFDEATIDAASVSDHSWFAAIGCESSTVVTFGLRCQRCGVSFRMPALYYVLTRPPTIAFFHDHDVDYRSLELEYGSDSWAWGTIPREDGALVRLAVDDERLEIELDRTLEIRSYRRTARE